MAPHFRNLRFGIGLVILSFLLPGPARALCDYFYFLLDPGQVVPPVVAQGSGSSELQLCDDDNVRGYIAVNVQETVTAIHMHGPASSGETGDLLYDLPVLGNEVSGRLAWPRDTATAGVVSGLPDVRRCPHGRASRWLDSRSDCQPRGCH